MYANIKLLNKIADNMPNVPLNKIGNIILKANSSTIEIKNK